MKHLMRISAEDQVAAWRREMADIDRGLESRHYTGRTLEAQRRRRQKLPRLIFNLAQAAGLPLSPATLTVAST